ncbi:MAG: flagellar protein FlgN [Halioglobus sp.]|nr:flagellar protein FlgN [Halioglobus sp.]
MPMQEQLQALLDQEIENLQTLLGILHREHDALVNADVDAIERITQSKNQALTAQAELTRSRRHLVQTAWGSDTDESLEQYIASFDDQSLWHSFSRLSALAMQCNDSNRTNGRLIAHKQQQTRDALDILRRTDSAATTTYSHSGRAAGSEQAGRTLGKA